MPSIPSLLIAGTRSGSGKTTLALCLMAALRRRGLVVQAFKAGPDFIDPGHHAAITGRPSCNLDTWMAGEDGVRAQWARLTRTEPHPHLLLGEGVMGLFDGADGLGGPGSTAHLARLLRLALLLVVDARGMGQSAAALAHGFVSLQSGLTFAGMVCTHVGGTTHQTMLREAFDAVFGTRLPLLGLLPRQDAPLLPSRHLGLVMAHERQWEEDRASMAAWVEAHMDVDALLEICRAHARSHNNTPEPGHASTAPDTVIPPAPSSGKRPRIGIARDEAFCFLYAHMPHALEALGAECVFFSPLRDADVPPDCQSLYFPGGYPELHAAALHANAPMREAVRAFAASGRRIYGECGGYIYLMDSVEVEGHVWPMCACLPLRCRLEQQRVALGYREVTPAALEVSGRETTEARLSGRGHEFHYARLLEEPHGPPLWRVRDRQGQTLPPEGLQQGSVWGSWIHLCPDGARALLAHIFQLPNL